MTVQVTTDHATTANPTLEVHRICSDCAPHHGRALCHTRIIGILLPDEPVTCPVCPDIYTCPTCHQPRWPRWPS